MYTNNQMQNERTNLPIMGIIITSVSLLIFVLFFIIVLYVRFDQKSLTESDIMGINVMLFISIFNILIHIPIIVFFAIGYKNRRSGFILASAIIASVSVFVSSIFMIPVAIIGFVAYNKQLDMNNKVNHQNINNEEPIYFTKSQY